MLLWALLTTLLIGASSAPTAIAGCTVSGCPALAAPVCGADGLTYMNECLAACQGVVISSQGGCSSSSGPRSVAAATSTVDVSFPAPVAATLPASAIQAYAAEGLRMVGLLRSSTFQTSMPVLTEAMLASEYSPNKGTTMMVTAHGHLYAAPPGTKLQGPAAGLQIAASDTPFAGAASEGEAPMQENMLNKMQYAVGADAWDTTGPDASLAAAGSSRHRRLVAANSLRRRHLQGIFGRDTRTEMQYTARYPLSATGHLMFTSPDDLQLYQCSGTLVGPFTVLTAAHCVVSRSGQVQTNISFSAGQTSHNSTGLGSAKGVRVYFNSEYLGPGEAWTAWDIGIVVIDRPFGVGSIAAYKQAVLAMSADASLPGHSSGLSTSMPRRLPGSVDYTTSPPLKNTLLLSAGYPGDKPLGSAWLMSCRLTDEDLEKTIVPNTCPIANGQSGAALIERRKVDGKARFYIRAIVSFEMCKAVCGAGVCCTGQASYNGALKITPYFQAFIDLHRHAKPDDGSSDGQ